MSSSPLHTLWNKRSKFCPRAQWHMPLTYLAASSGIIKFAFNGDLFAFLNGQLAVNLGGIHSLQTQTVDLTTVRGSCCWSARQLPCEHMRACRKGTRAVYFLSLTLCMERADLF